MKSEKECGRWGIRTPDLWLRRALILIFITYSNYSNFLKIKDILPIFDFGYLECLVYLEPIWTPIWTPLGRNEFMTNNEELNKGFPELKNS